MTDRAGEEQKEPELLFRSIEEATSEVYRLGRLLAHAEQRVADARAIIDAKIKAMPSAASAFYVTDLMDIDAALTAPPPAQEEA